jgi:hypothetical protein
MKPERREDGWWITEIPGCEDCGPYDTKADATDDMQGVKRFFKYCDEPGYLTNERPD